MPSIKTEVDPRTIPIDTSLVVPLPEEDDQTSELRTPEVHTIIVEGIYGNEEVEKDTGSLRR